MIGVARDVLARRPVDGPAAVDLVEVPVAPRLQLLGQFIRQPRALIFRNEGALLDLLGGEQAEPGAGASDAEGFLAGHARDIWPIRAVREVRTSADALRKREQTGVER